MSEILKYCKRIEPVGSRVTCIPIPVDTDEDFLVLIHQQDFEDFVACLDEQGFVVGGSHVYAAESYALDGWEGFQSWKKERLIGGPINFIVTCSEEFFNLFMKATAICKEQNLLEKNERIKVFQRILYNNENWQAYDDLEAEF